MATTREQYLALLDRQPVVPGPMCGISDRAFRQLCREQGGEFAYTQMASAEGLARDHRKTVEVLDLRGEEPWTGMQVFGCDPERLAEGARRLQDLGAAVVDLNMGCPARKVTGGEAGAGSALLRKPQLVREILGRMRRAVTVPLTAKMRWDWDEGEGRAALEIARIAEGEGLDGLCLHARTRQEGYSGKADWSRVAELKAATSLPVIGNGDVRSAGDAVAMMSQTGCEAVMIGRGVIGDPWLLGRALRSVLRWRAAGRPGKADADFSPEPDAPPSWAERRETMLRHARLMTETKGRRGLIEFRKHAAAYLRGVRGVKRMRRELMSASAIEDLEALLSREPDDGPEDFAGSDGED